MLTARIFWTMAARRSAGASLVDVSHRVDCAVIPTDTSFDPTRKLMPATNAVFDGIVPKQAQMAGTAA
jgi:hypothetical protein